MAGTKTITFVLSASFSIIERIVGYWTHRLFRDQRGAASFAMAARLSAESDATG